MNAIEISASPDALRASPKELRALRLFVCPDETRPHNDAKHTCATWIIPSDPLDGWYWSLDTQAAKWEGIVMPRRI